MTKSYLEPTNSMIGSLLVILALFEKKQLNPLCSNYWFLMLRGTNEAPHP
jgi:hypothetical protein